MNFNAIIRCDRCKNEFKYARPYPILRYSVVIMPVGRIGEYAQAYVSVCRKCINKIGEDIELSLGTKFESRSPYEELKDLDTNKLDEYNRNIREKATKLYIDIVDLFGGERDN